MYYCIVLQAAEARIQRLLAETQRKETETHRLKAELRDLQSQLHSVLVSQLGVNSTGASKK